MGIPARVRHGRGDALQRESASIHKQSNPEVGVAENVTEAENPGASSGGGPHGTRVLSPEDLPNGAESGGHGTVNTLDRPALVGVTDPFTDRRFPLQPERTLIGRDSRNDIVLDVLDVSLEHARIVRSGGEWRIVDLNSTNGTYINGDRVNQGALQYGDFVAFGPDAFLFAAGVMSSGGGGATGFASTRRRWWGIAAAGALVVALVVILLLL